MIIKTTNVKNIIVADNAAKKCQVQVPTRNNSIVLNKEKLKRAKFQISATATFFFMMF